MGMEITSRTLIVFSRSEKRSNTLNLQQCGLGDVKSSGGISCNSGMFSFDPMRSTFTLELFDRFFPFLSLLASFDVSLREKLYIYYFLKALLKF